MTAKDILDTKGRHIHGLHEDASVADAVSELANHNIGLLIIRNSSGSISGVLSERDIIQKCIFRKKDPALMKAGDLMTPSDKIVIAAEGDNVQSIMNTMTEKKVRHIPIFNGRELSGIISIGDIIKTMLDIKEYEIKTLIEYISGKYPG